jgi:hypothetical protein
VYDERSPLYGYLCDNGLAEQREAFVAANSLLEELEEGSMPEHK